jgi:hypothetical protein
MTTRRYFQFCLAIPVILPLLAIPFTGSALRGPALLLISPLVIGGVPYLLFAAVLAMRIERSHPLRVPVLVALSPVTFAPVQAACTAIAGFTMTAFGRPGTAWGGVSVPEILVWSLMLGVVAACLALAYVLVALVAYAALRRLDWIDDALVSASARPGTAPSPPRVVIATRAWFRWSPFLILALACVADRMLIERRMSDRLAIHLLIGVAVLSAPLMAELSLYVDRSPGGRRAWRGDHELDPRAAIVLFWRSPLVLALLGVVGLVALKVGLFVSTGLQGRQVDREFWSEVPLLIARWVGLSLGVGYAIVLASSAGYLMLLRMGAIDDRLR